MRDDELTRLAHSRLGQTLRGKYRLDRVLGIGGMAAVYAATHRNKKQFAIKMLHPALSFDGDIRARFVREGYVANSVGHPGAVAVLDDDVAEDGSAFLVMELLAGAPVDAVWETHGRHLPLALALSIGDALLDVLGAAHTKGIVHRDIKPANLFLTNDGRLEVLDFGIARLREAGSLETTATGALLGTPAYMAPELALAKSNEVDAQTDIWAVGATLFSLLTGELVHQGDNAPQMLVNAATNKARSVGSLAPELPEGVARVIDRALAFGKADRWTTADQMRLALGNACVETTGEAVSPLPKREWAPEVTGYEATVASNPELKQRSSTGAFAPTLEHASDPNRRAAAASGPRMLQPSTKGRRVRATWIAGATALVLITVVGATAARRHPFAAPPLASATPSAPVPPRAGRVPATPEAAAAYGAAVVALGDGNLVESERKLTAAITSDPALGAAYLRLAFDWSMAPTYDEALARSYYQKAREQRSTLGDSDTALLDAWEPRFRTPPDRLERGKRMRDVAARFPDDPYVELLLGISLRGSGALDEADAAFDRALLLDPHFVQAFAGKIELATRRGDAAGATALLDRCLTAAPSGVTCLWRRFQAASAAGRCEDARTDVMKVLAIEPSTKEYQFGLAQVLGALGEPPDVLAEVLRNAGNRIPDPDERRMWELDSKALVATLGGDFVTADATLEEEIAFDDSHPRSPISEHSLSQLRILIEAGDTARARPLLKRVRARLLARDTGDPSEIESAAVFLYLEHQAGVTSRERLREEQASLVKNAREAQTKGTGHVDPAVLWKRIYVDASDRQDAADALLALPTFGPITDTSFQEPEMGMTLGRIYALGGRGAEAIPLLRKETQSCAPLDDVLQSTYAWYFLGIALEDTGDVAGARDAYGKVLARWGSAKPRSLAADGARAGLARMARQTRK